MVDDYYLRALRATLLDARPVTHDDVGLWYRTMRRDPCPLCGTWMILPEEGSSHPADATKDHIVPRSQGGATTLENIVMLCRTCNENKADQSLLEHLMAGGLRRKRRDFSDDLASRRRGAYIVCCARTFYGRDVLERASQRARKRRQMIAWVALRLRVRAVDAAFEMFRTAAAVREMAGAWEKEWQTEWGRQTTLEFVRYLKERYEG
jgi:hypothetical protein